jgi:hypothetical protein
MCKLMEEMANKRLRRFLETNSFFSHLQSGFHSFRFTTEQLFKLETEICDAFINSQHFTVISSDAEEDHDVVWKNGIISSLMTKNITGSMSAFASNFLEIRGIQFRTNGLRSKQTEIQNGIPQRSALGVALFMIAINDTADNITPSVQCCLLLTT